MKLSGIKIILLAVLLSSVSANAQNKLNLKDCMVYALENSAKMKIQKLDTDDARVLRRDAILNLFTPQVSAGTYAYSNFGRSVDPETNTYVSTTSFNNGYSVSGGITLFNGFSAVNNAKIYKTALNMGIEMEQLVEDEICLAVMEAYCNILYYGELVKILEAQVQTSSQMLILAKKQEELGQKGYSDVIGVDAELADRESQLISTRNMYADAILTLKDIMFWPTDRELLLDESILQNVALFAVPNMEEKEQVIDYAVNNMPSVAIAKGTMQNALLDLKSAKWKFSPSLSLYAGWSTSYYTYPGMEGYVPAPFHTQFRNNGGEYIQLSLSIPIFDRFSIYSNLRRKKNTYSRASLQYDQKVREVEAEVTRAIQDRDGALAAFKQADKRVLLQKEVYQLNNKQLEYGLISIIDFQKVSDNWLNAESCRLDALLKYYIKNSIVNYYKGTSYISQF